MSMTKDDAVNRARADMAKRLGISEEEIAVGSVESADFPDMALGASVEDEMSGQMITSAWRIRLDAGLKGILEYRATERQVRLHDYRGENYIV
jgi:hypothetical protein